MSESQENSSPTSFPTSEVGSGTRERDGDGLNASEHVAGSAGAGSIGSAFDGSSGRGSGAGSILGPGADPGLAQAATLLQLLRGLAGGLQPTPPPRPPVALVRFDPDDADADIEAWCKINEVIVKQMDLKGTELLLLLMKALRGRAASCLSKIQPDCITWENVKNVLIAKFAKPMFMQDYFDRIIKFKISEKETAADAGMRLWHLIETVPQIEFSEEVITGFAVSILSNCDYYLRRDLNAHSITSKSQLCRVLRGVSAKRPNEEKINHTEYKRPRLNMQRSSTFVFNGNCHRCGQAGHKFFNCPQSHGESSQMYKPTATAPPRFEERRPVTCYACGKQGHLASACGAAAALRESTQTDRKSVV